MKIPKTLAIPYWLALALCVYFVSSVSPFVVVGAVICASEKAPQETVTLSTMLSTDVAEWEDPVWQHNLAVSLPDSMSVVLLKADQELFRFGKPPRDPTPAGYTQVVVMDGARQLGIADLYDVSPCGGQIYGTLAIPASLAIQVFVGLCIVWVLARYVMRPLTAMRGAARQIAVGNLDFQLPPSRVREVAEVATAFHAMGDALRTSLIRQAELEQDRRFFISAVAHDLRTPLFALRGYLEGLEKGLATTPEMVSHYIQVCHEKADALEHLIADLFAYSRMEYLEQMPQREPIDFSKLVESAVNDIRPRAEALNISLDLESPSVPCDVEGDWSLLTRSLSNLLDNALRYAPSGGWIRVAWSKANGIAQFVVADSGPGIAPQDLPHLFTPLFRAESSRNRQTGGAGLGLTIARRILQAHRGDLVVHNGANGGAEFTGTFQAH
jgi:signal transduction histidine kinase